MLNFRADFDSLAREHPIKIVFAWQNKHPLRPDLVVLVGPLASSRYHDPDNNFILSNQNAFDLIIIWNDWAEYPKPIKIHSELNSIANFRNRWLRISPHDQDNGTRILNQQLKLVTKIFGRPNSVTNMDKQKTYSMSHIVCGRHNETQTWTILFLSKELLSYWLYFHKNKGFSIKLAMEELLNQQLWLTIFETCDKEYLKLKIFDESDFKRALNGDCLWW